MGFSDMIEANELYELLLNFDVHCKFKLYFFFVAKFNYWEFTHPILVNLLILS